MFTNGTYKFTDAFHLSAGVRYAKNDQEFRQIATARCSAADDPGESDEDVVTYSLSPEWHSAKTRCCTRASPPAIAPAAPTSSSPAFRRWWIGRDDQLRGRRQVEPGGRRRQIEAAAFYMDWEDIQLGVTFPNGLRGLANAGSAESQGVEGSLHWLAGENFTFGFNGAYIDAKLTSDTTRPAARTATGCRARRSGAARCSPTTCSRPGGNLDWQFGGVAALRRRSHLGSEQRARDSVDGGQLYDRRPQRGAHDQRPLDGSRVSPGTSRTRMATSRVTSIGNSSLVGWPAISSAWCPSSRARSASVSKSPSDRRRTARERTHERPPRAVLRANVAGAAEALPAVPRRRHRGRLREDRVRPARLGARALRRRVRDARGDGHDRAAAAHAARGARAGRALDRDRRRQHRRRAEAELDPEPRRRARGGPRRRLRHARPARLLARAQGGGRAARPAAHRRPPAARGHPGRHRPQAHRQAPARRSAPTARSARSTRRSRSRARCAAAASTRISARPARPGS